MAPGAVQPSFGQPRNKTKRKRWGERRGSAHAGFYHRSSDIPAFSRTPHRVVDSSAGDGVSVLKDLEFIDSDQTNYRKTKNDRKTDETCGKTMRIQDEQHNTSHQHSQPKLKSQFLMMFNRRFLASLRLPIFVLRATVFGSVDNAV